MTWVDILEFLPIVMALRLLIEDDGPSDNQTYELCERGSGLQHTDTGVEL